MIPKRLERLFLQLFIHTSERLRNSRTSAAKSQAAQLWLIFRWSYIPTSMYLRITRIKLGRNLRKSGGLEIRLLFDVVLQNTVTVLQTHNFTCGRYAVRLSSLTSGMS